MTNPSSRHRRAPVGGSREMVGRLLAGVVAALAGGLCWATPSALGQPVWSPTVSLVRCASVAAPRVVFPQADPFHASGQGAIVWSGAPADCNPADAKLGPGVGIAEFEPDHTLGAPIPLPATRGPRLTGLSAAVGSGDGRIVLTGSTGFPTGAAAGLTQGLSRGPFAPAVRLAGQSPIAVTSSYRGDVAVASVDPTGMIELRLEVHGTPRLSSPIVLSRGGSPVTALAVNIDYRGDAIVAWAAKGAIYVRVRAVNGVVLPTQRVAASPASARLGVLISDDNRAIVGWESDQPAGPGQPTMTSVHLAISVPGVHFGRPRLVERFVDPPGVRPSPTGLQLVRLAYEGVVMAWTGLTNGHLVVRSAQVSLSSVRPTATVSAPDADAMLSALATGPRDEVLALWTAAPRLGGQPDPSQQRVLAARGASAPTGITSFDAPQVVAGPGPVSTPSVAIDPVTDVAVAVWRTGGRNPGIDYAVRGTKSAASVAGRPAGRAPTGGHGTGVFPAIALGALCALGLVVGGVRRRIRRKDDRLRRSPFWSPSASRHDP